MMVFGTKPKKAQSLKPKDKRRISLLNSDFKIVEGLDGKRFRKITSHCLSKVQYVAGKDRKIDHGISRARDAIQAASNLKEGCGIADTDFVAAFDWLVLTWVWKVLLKLGVSRAVVSRVQSFMKIASQSLLSIISLGVSSLIGEVLLGREDVHPWNGLLLALIQCQGTLKNYSKVS